MYISDVPIPNFNLLLMGINVSDFSIAYANDAIEHYLSVSVSTFMGKNYFQLIEHNPINNLLPNTLPIQTSTFTISNFENQESTISWTTLLFQENMYLLLGINISFIREIIKKNIELQTYLDNLLNQIPGYLYWKDKNSIYLGCNANFAKVAGLKAPHEIIGKTDYDLVWKDTEADIFRAGDQEALAGIQKLNFEEPQLMANGKYATVLANKVPLRDKRNNIIGVLGIYNDITERKYIEQNLAVEKIKAEAANKAKSEFIENMSHDLKTPLNGIIGFSSILLSREKDPEKIEFIKGIKHSGEKLLFLLNEILDFSHLEEGNIAIQKKEFNLKELVNDIKSILSIQAQEKNIYFIVEYSISIPQNIISDSHRIHRIIFNLANNALKFTHQGKIEIRVDWIEDNNSGILISVKDTGIGIPEDKFNIIFDRFTRLEASHKGRYEGTGLGLGIVKQFLTDLGGDISIKSEVGVGSTFNCYIPVSVPVPNILTVEKQILTKEINAVNDKKIKVLVVEDEKLSQMVIVTLLNDLNCSCSIASSCEEAINNLDKDYNIIFTDIGLPDKNGINLAKIFRNDYHIEIPIIAMTAHLSHSLKTNCLEVGIQDIFAKPLSKEILKEILSKYVTQKENKTGI
ncbi:MAG: Aerobic respiration control sensor protein ArcB [Legionellaceae bacterium]